MRNKVAKRLYDNAESMAIGQPKSTTKTVHCQLKKQYVRIKASAGKVKQRLTKREQRNRAIIG